MDNKIKILYKLVLERPEQLAKYGFFSDDETFWAACWVTGRHVADSYRLDKAFKKFFVTYLIKRDALVLHNYLHLS